MNYLPEKREIILDRELNKLDRFVINFCSLLEKYTKYVIVSGYVSIVLGRSRATEDVDLLVPRMEFSNFVEMFNNFLNKGYDCINTTNPKEAFEMLDETAIRFFKQGNPLPNIEFKFIKNDLDEYSFENRLKLVLNEGTLFISPLELQIAYKLFLSSEKADKDIEDARHLYKIFQDKINKETLAIFIRKLNVEKRFKELE